LFRIIQIQIQELKQNTAQAVEMEEAQAVVEVEVEEKRGCLYVKTYKQPPLQ